MESRDFLSDPMGEWKKRRCKPVGEIFIDTYIYMLYTYIYIYVCIYTPTYMGFAFFFKNNSIHLSNEVL